jgi:hypothetical protein
VSFVVCKTTSKLKRVILTTVYLVDAKNTDKGLLILGIVEELKLGLNGAELMVGF